MGKKLKQLLALAMCLLCLTACAGENSAPGDDGGSGETPASDIFAVTARIGDSQDTLDPAMATARGSETIPLHLYENLMRWEDDGQGYARLTYGQAESYTVQTDYAGNATYSFTLRGNITWSNGEPVTAQDFVTAWRRLADPATDSPHRGLLHMIAGYDRVQETGDTTALAISAPSDSTLLVTLNGSCPYFLEEVCAGAYTMPVAASMAEKAPDWSGLTDETVQQQVVTNGPFVLSHFSPDRVTLAASDSYYGRKSVGPEELTFIPSDSGDAGAFAAGEVQLIASRAAAGDETENSAAPLPDPVTSTQAVVINTLQPPFDDPAIRRAFALAIDPQALTETLGDPLLRAAEGLVPYGVTDYGMRSDPNEKAEADVLPDPNAAPVEEEPALYWDFRAHGRTLVTQGTGSDYAANCQQARALMAQAGYAGGGGFPVVEYIYEESDENYAVALALQTIWKETLGVTVTVRGLSGEEYRQMLLPPASAGENGTDPEPSGTAPYQLAGMTFAAPYSDAAAFLSRWHTAREDNPAAYSSSAFDILLDSAAAAVSFEARDAYLHDAEAILLSDAPVIPLFCLSSVYTLAADLTGLYRAPDGVFFLSTLEKNNPQ